MCSTKVEFALVDVFTLESISFITLVTSTFVRTDVIGTNGMNVASTCRVGTFINVFTIEAIAFIPYLALTSVAAVCVHTIGIGAAAVFTAAFIDIYTRLG